MLPIINDHMKNLILKLVLLVLISSLMSSCWWYHNIPPDFYSVDIFYRNIKGEDLFNLATTGHFNKDSVIIHWNDGVNRQMTGEIIPFDLQQSNALVITQDHASFHTNTKIIQLSRSDYDTLTFVYDKSVMQDCLYNNVHIAPPSGMMSYPYKGFPIIIYK